MSDRLNFWIAGPEHIGNPRPVIYQKITVENPDDTQNPDAIANEIAFWMPNLCPVGTQLDEETEETCAFLANRANFDDNNKLYIYQEAYGKWNAEFIKAMNSSKLELEEHNGVNRLIHKGNLDPTINFDGWSITSWTVEKIVLSQDDIDDIDDTNLTTDTPLIWDIIVWEKVINGDNIVVTARHGWPWYKNEL
jgi:hypothetical protein